MPKASAVMPANIMKGINQKLERMRSQYLSSRVFTAGRLATSPRAATLPALPKSSMRHAPLLMAIQEKLESTTSRPRACARRL